MEQTASWAQRALALLVDWIVSSLIVIGVIGPAGWNENAASGLYVLGVFVLESTLLTALLGGSFGKLLVRLRVVRVDGSGRPVDLLHCLLRQVMVALVIPPLVYRPDGRGLHDMAAGSATATLASLQGRK
ncbi:RDD family protein [Nocardioides daejeonensis]|uniref:RDD family protein n=1 Tax=Nocardioides daejeonensis TaxID=1046556 RepID=UPI000D74BF0F|nr:RDD family protein [Nocardioides daejeonensis]